MRVINSVVAIGLAMTIASSAGLAHGQDLTENDWSFNLFNDSSYTISAFSVFEEQGYWSDNWLRSSMRPGIGLTLDWPHRNDSRCVVPVQVLFTDGAVYEQDVDFCGTAAVYVDDVGINY